jgi:hypothetical protein
MIIKKFKLFEAAAPWSQQQLIMLWEAYMSIVNGIDGIISEEGELSNSYWKDNVEKDLDNITNYVKNIEQIEEKKSDIIKNFGELLDGLKGAMASGRINQSRYFQKGVIAKAQAIYIQVKDQI